MNEIKVEEFNSKLIEKGVTICCAESITAGLLASTIASVPGASSILKGSIVTYSRELKTAILKVHPNTVDTYSAESIQTTTEMAYGLIKIYPSAKLYIAVTGVATAGVEGSGVVKPLGQVYISIYYNGKITEIEEIIKFTETDFVKIRNEIRHNTVKLILHKVLELLQ